MGKRREAREAALQVLFSHDLNPELDDPEAEAFWEMRPAEASVRQLAEETVKDVLENQEAIDTVLDGAIANYEIGRLSAVDRNILRIAIYEMHFRTDIPPLVSLNEALEIAKRFSTEKSSAFVNGVLDRIVNRLDRPLREATGSAGDP